jgi:hypothetical protein
MQRIMIAPPTEVLEQIRDIATKERRTPKEQIEYILIQHVREKHCPGANNTEAANAPNNPPAGDSNGAP